MLTPALQSGAEMAHEAGDSSWHETAIGYIFLRTSHTKGVAGASAHLEIRCPCLQLPLCTLLPSENQTQKVIGLCFL